MVTSTERRGSTALDSRFQFNNSYFFVKSRVPFEDAARLADEQTARIVFHPLSSLRLAPSGHWEWRDRTQDKSLGCFSVSGFSRFCASLKLPAAFIKELSAFNPSAAAAAINTIASHRGDSLRLAFDGETLEGVVSPRFTRITNSQVIEAVRRETKAEVINRFRLEGLRMRANLHDAGDGVDMGHMVRDLGSRGLLRKDDIINTGLDIYHAEDGGTALSVCSYLWRVLCLNGAVSEDERHRSKLYHSASDIASRMDELIQNAALMNKSRFQMVVDSITRNVSENVLKSILDDAAKKFGMKFANRLLASAQQEAEYEQHEGLLSLYNLWNGITVQAHRSNNMVYSRDVEVYAMYMLKQRMRQTANTTISQ